MRHAGAHRLAIAAALALTQLSCVVLPVRSAPGVTGRVLDEASGESLAGAHVVVRFDGRYGDLLPDREQLGHAEALSDAEGRFRVGRFVRPGLSLWPLFRTEARVVAVLRVGFTSCMVECFLSRLWRCCSTINSPLSLVLYYQLRNWYSMSVHASSRPRCHRAPAL